MHQPVPCVLQWERSVENGGIPRSSWRRQNDNQSAFVCRMSRDGQALPTAGRSGSNTAWDTTAAAAGAYWSIVIAWSFTGTAHWSNSSQLSRQIDVTWPQFKELCTCSRQQTWQGLVWSPYQTANILEHFAHWKTASANTKFCTIIYLKERYWKPITVLSCLDIIWKTAFFTIILDYTTACRHYVWRFSKNLQAQ